MSTPPHTPNFVSENDWHANYEQDWLRDLMSPDNIRMNIVDHYLDIVSQNVDFQMAPASTAIPAVLALQI